METTIEFFQTTGADETLRLASQEFELNYRGRRVVEAKFGYAQPGDRSGRWVGIVIRHELDRGYVE